MRQEVANRGGGTGIGRARGVLPQRLPANRIRTEWHPYGTRLRSSPQWAREPGPVKRLIDPHRRADVSDSFGRRAEVTPFGPLRANDCQGSGAGDFGGLVRF